MSNELQTAIFTAGLKILRPLVRVFLRNGIACGEFIELVRKAYVDEAFAMPNDGSKVTISSVSAKTGLSRKEVKRLHEMEQHHDGSNSSKYNRAVRVITGWMNDSRFATPDGEAMPLPMEQAENSFAELAKDYSGDIPHKAMFKLLESSGCVELNGGRVHLTRHAYVPGNDSEEVIAILGTDSNELMETIDHNLTCADDNKHYQRKVSSNMVAASAVDEFQAYAGKRSQALLEELDAWLSKHETTKGDDARYVSLGIYYFEKKPEEEVRK